MTDKTMLDQFKTLYKYKIQFSSDTQIGYVNVVTFGKKSDAINLFLKYCRLKNPQVIDCKFIGVIVDKDGGGSIGTLTMEVNGEVVGEFSGESTTIEIGVPTKTSELINDSSFITPDNIPEEVVDEIAREIEEEFMPIVEKKENKVQEIDENSTEDQYPSAKAVYDLIEKLSMSDEELYDIING